MAEITIPERHKSGLLKLLNLPAKSFQQMISALEETVPKLYSDDLAIEVGSKTKGVSSNDVTEIITALVSLFSHWAHQDTSPEALADEVKDAMAEAGLGNEEKHELFKRRLIQLFKIENLVVVSKSLGVLLSNENNFCTARILTDIRPVFGSSVETAPTAAVIVHMLNLSYHHGDEIKEFYVALDTVDVQTLREAIDRAELKTQSLKSLIKAAGLTYLDRLE